MHEHWTPRSTETLYKSCAEVSSTGKAVHGESHDQESEEGTSVDGKDLDGPWQSTTSSDPVLPTN
jgi:hypothetical protein